MRARWLLGVALLPAGLAAQANPWTVGSRVHVSAGQTVCARADTIVTGTGTCGTGGGLHNAGEKGTITRGPAGGTTKWGWSWFIHYDTPPDGWSTQGLLTLDSLAGPPAAVVTTVTVSPSVVRVMLGQPVQLAATLTTSAGAVVSGPVTWSATGAASVNGTGLMVPVSVGTGTVTATSQNGVRGSAAVTVQAAGPAPVAVVKTNVGGSVTITTIGGTFQAFGYPYDSSGALVSTPVSWRSSTPAVAAVSAAGLVTAVGLGADTVVATAGGKAGSFLVYVGPPTPGDTTTLTWSVGGIQVPSLPSLRHFSLPITLTLYSRPCYVLNFTAPGTDSVVTTTTACLRKP